jgi:hypothetical protein
MAIAFPSNPTTNQIFTANNNSWRWNGEYWKSQTGAASVYISDSAPTTPVAGTLWFNSVSGKTFVYYSDADSVQWIEVGGTTAASSSNNNVSQYTTSNLAEGSNLYYTTARATAAARAAISVTGTGGNYNSSTGVITLPYTVLTSINGQTGAVTLTTSNVAEGTNLYYTDARARAAISVTGSGSYDSATGIITVSAAAVPKVTGVAVTDSSYAALDDTAVSTAGGYIKITGTGFVTGCQVLIGTVAATSVSFVSSTEVRAQLPATAAGTYIMYLVNPDGSVAIRVNAVTFSATPVWSTGSTLPGGTSGSTISIQLAATGDSSITYALASNSTLPAGLALSSSGLLSGTVSGLSVETIYNFTVVANDAENQDTSRAFSVTISIKDANFPYVTLLLETGSASSLNTTVTDSSASPNTVTRTANPSTGWISPYQTDGYWGNFFNGSTDYLSAPSSTNLGVSNGNFTVEFWYFQSSARVSSYPTIIHNASTWAANSWGVLVDRVDSAGKITVWVNNVNNVSPVITSTASITIGLWYHIAVVRNSSTLSLYINGSLDSTASVSTTSFDSGTNPMYIGWQGTNTLLNGYLSNLRLVKGTAVYTGAFTVPTSPLQKTQSSGTNISAITGSQTSLLTCQSNRFIDNSNNTFTITPTGTPQVTPYFYPSGFTAPAASPGAALFNGSSQYLSATNNVAFQMGTGDYTVDFWAYPLSFSGFPVMIELGRAAAGSTTGLQIDLNSSGNIVVYGGTAISTLLITSSQTLSLSSWVHIALTRSSAGTKLYVNGAQSGSTASDSTNYNNGYLWVGINAGGATGGAYQGYLSNLRVVKGVAVYTGAFTPPTLAFLQTSGAASAASYPSTTNVNTSFAASSTSLLLNLADSNYLSATNGVQNNTFIDSSNYAFPITRNGTPTQGSITPYWPNGQWSNYFSGTSDWLNSTASTVLQFGSNAYTVEGWIYQTSRAGTTSSTYQFICGGVFSGTGYQVILFDSGYISFGIPGFASLTAATIAIPLNAWTHFALVRTSTSTNGFAYYINGAAAGTITDANNYSGTTTTLNVAATNNTLGGNPPLTGYLSNFRIVKGTAVYTGAFTPPTSPLAATQSGNGGTIQAITGTQTSLLTCQSNRFVDNSAQVTPATLTPTGTPRVQAFQPFSPTASYTTALYGGSGYFNGSTDFLTFTDSTNVLDMGNATASLEMWIYFNNSGRTIIRKDGGVDNYNTTNGLEWAFAITGSPAFVFYSNSGGSFQALTDSVARIYNTWYHVVIATNATTQSLYVNGTRTATLTAGITKPTTRTSVRAGSDLGSNYFSGYISNMRFIQGTGAYDASQTTLTVPTSPVTAVTNTSLLLNFTNAAIYDAAAQNDLTTVGDAKTDTTVYKWPSTASMKFDGSGDLLYTPSNVALDLVAVDFTIEFWFNANSISSGFGCIVGKVNWPGSSGSGWAVFQNNQQIVFFYPAASTDGFATGNVITSTGTWHYVAIVRSGTATNNTKIYINGVQQAQGTSTISASTNGMVVGGINSTYGWNNNFYTNGYIQDLRITRGVARTITASPTAAFITR